MTTDVCDTEKASTYELQNKCINTITVLNSVIIVIGIGVAGVGVFVNVGGNVLRSQMGSASVWLSTQLQSVGLGDIDLSNFDLVELLQEFSTPLLVMGMYCCILAGCGTFAAKKRITVLILVYSSCVALGLLIQAVAVFIIFAQRKVFEGALKTSLMKGLQESYRGYNETNLLSQTWNIVMISLHCCGVNDYKDFKEATQWRRRLFQDGWWFNLKTPVTCCNLERKDPGDFACAVNPLDYTSYFKQGCYDAAWKAFDSNRGFSLTAIVALMTVQLILLAASTMLAHGLRKISKKSKRDSEEDEESQIANISAEEKETITNTNKNREIGRGIYQTTDDIKENTANTSIFSSLPFTGLGGYRTNDPFQQYLSNDRRNSFSPDLLSQFLSGQNRYNRMSYDFGFPNSRMPSFDFGFLQNRMPSSDYGVPQGPVIVQLQQQPNQKADLKAIMDSVDEDRTNASPKKETAETDDTEKKSKKSKVSFRTVGRCKSENCINANKKIQTSSESNKRVLSRRETLPKVSESLYEAPKKDGDNR